MLRGLFSSLRNRVFLASALVAIAALAFALQFVTTRATRSAEVELRRSLEEAATLVGHTYATRLDTLLTTARLVADLPVLKAAVTTDAVTVEPVARDYAALVKAHLLAIANHDGVVLARVGSQKDAGVGDDAVREALLGHEHVGFRAGPSGVLQVVTVPMVVRSQAPEVLGTLSLGLALDTALAGELRGVTESEVAFAWEGQVVASSLQGADASALSAVLGAGATAEVRVQGNDYVALARPLFSSAGPVFIVLRSRTERLRFLEPLRTALFAAAAAAVLGAVVLSFLVSRTVTRPLAQITEAMHEIARTGDFSRKVSPGPTSTDEDARVLASAFNSLLDSVARFQREAAEKERLSALGRLSTVIAHEVRNPLMIIKASLRDLRRPGRSPSEMEEAAADVDHEVARLNRIVGDVLDFARPPRLEIQATDLNAVCQDAASASLAGDEHPRLRLDLAFPGGPLQTDGELLRTALVNVLGNAREAVRGRTEEATAPARTTRPRSSCAPPPPDPPVWRSWCVTAGPASPPPTFPTYSSPTSPPSAAAPAWVLQ